MGLKEYNQKRDFSYTKEPKGKVKNKKSKRFVIQYHQARAKHYDLRLEYKGVLLSWAVPKGLSTDPEDKRLAVMVEDHPVDYIDFEGIIPKGNYGAGTVEIFDSGNYQPLESFEKGLKKGHLKFVLNGAKLKGGWSLIKIDDKNWLAKKIEDDFAGKRKPTKLPFNQCDVQLAKLSNNLPKGKDWVFEIKYDGYRIISFVEKGKVKMITRNGVDYTSKFSSLAKSLKAIEKENFVVDGEVVAFDEKGRSDFGLLQERIKNKGQLHYVVFDILALDGEDLRKQTLKERKEILERVLYKANDNLIYSSHVLQGKKSFDFAKKNNLEGIIAKKASSVYSGTRNGDWLKIKCYLRQEFVICGYTTSEKNQDLSALLLGYYHNGKLKYVGKVGTGFSETLKKELSEKLKKLSTPSCPFDEKNLKAFWVKPQLVAEIQFAELTKDNILRQPSFIGLRKDKKPKDVVLEKGS